ncbi:hypothetical protein ACFPRL_02490 [Pseudoclavibacter helvolus]
MKEPADTSKQLSGHAGASQGANSWPDSCDSLRPQRFSRVVVPSCSQAWVWSRSHVAAGCRQPGQRQWMSRAVR